MFFIIMNQVIAKFIFAGKQLCKTVHCRTLLNVAIVRLCRTNVSEMVLAKLHNLQLSHTEFRNYPLIIFAL